MTTILDDRVLDFGLNILATESNKCAICTTQPTTYAQATTLVSGGGYALAIYTYLGSAFFSPAASSSPTGRKVTFKGVTAAPVSEDGTAAYWAIVDSTNSRLLVSGAFDAALAVYAVAPFSIGGFDIVFASSATLFLMLSAGVYVAPTEDSGHGELVNFIRARPSAWRRPHRIAAITRE